MEGTFEAIFQSKRIPSYATFARDAKLLTRKVAHFTRIKKAGIIYYDCGTYL